VIKYLDIFLRKIGLVRAASAEAQILKLNTTIEELKEFQDNALRCNAGNVVGMYG